MFFTKKIYQTNSICPFHLLYTVKEYQKISMGCGISKTKMFKEMYQSYWNSIVVGHVGKMSLLCRRY